MNSDIQSFAAISVGFKRSHERLEAPRRDDIRRSDTISAIRAFDLAFKTTIKNALIREMQPLTKMQRKLFGVDV